MAIAVKSGYKDSEISAVTLNISLPQAESPVFSKQSGQYTGSQTVTITSSTDNATIYYTTDGSNPPVNSSRYSGPMTVDRTQTIKAIAVKSGYKDSEISAVTLNISLPQAESPVFSKQSGLYTGSQTVTIASNTENAAIHYSTDGSDPTTSSSMYSDPITVDRTQTIKAIAVKSGYKDSEITSSAYYIKTNAEAYEKADYAFSGYPSVLVIDSSFKSIGPSAFSGCTGLESITIPSSVTSIGKDAFFGCEALTSLTIPSSVTSIGQSAFWGCTGLDSLTIPSSVTSIGQSAFSGCPASIIFADGTKAIPASALYLASSVTSVAMPSSVTSIGKDAFLRCEALTSLTIPSSVTSIGESAFNGCYGLTNVNIPSSVTSIGKDAFFGCEALTSLTIPSSVTSIGQNAFFGCTGSIIFADGTKAIPDGALRGASSMTSVTIPSSVTSIGQSAFNGCTELTTIMFKGTQAQWNSISKGSNWDFSIPATSVSCSNGTVAI